MTYFFVHLIKLLAWCNKGEIFPMHQYRVIHDALVFVGWTEIFLNKIERLRNLQNAYLWAFNVNHYLSYYKNWLTLIQILILDAPLLMAGYGFKMRNKHLLTWDDVQNLVVNISSVNKQCIVWTTLQFGNHFINYVTIKSVYTVITWLQLQFLIENL